MGIKTYEDLYQKTKLKSPVYQLNCLSRKKLYKYIQENGYDYIITTHLFAAQALTAIKKKHPIHFIAVATDYVCIPFWDETNPDYFIIPSEELTKAIRPTTILITVMFANNEIGTIQLIKEIGKIAKEHQIVFHTDAVQAVGNVKIDVKEMQIDSLSMSGHKFYGPKGIGALYVKKGVKFDTWIHGGHQERNKRAGTENVAGIVGLGTAIELAYRDMEEHNRKIKELRDYYVKQVEQRIPYIRINGDRERRLPGNSNISFRFIEGEGLLLNLDLKGICASSGSACTSGSLDPSHVLLAIGLPHEIAHGSLRISIGKYNTKEEVDYLIENL